MRRRAEYGTLGAIGALGAQDNAVVETEARVLLGPEVALFAARVPASGNEAAELEHALELADGALGGLANLPVDLACFAMPGAAYIAGERRESQVLAALASYRGFPVISAAQATTHALEMLHARRIALVSVHRGHLAQSMTAYWRTAGFKVIDVAHPDADAATHAGFVTGASVLAAARSIDAQNVDAIVLADCELPSLHSLDAMLRPGAEPVISTTLALSWAAAHSLARTPADADSLARWLSVGAPWRERFGRDYAAARSGQG